MSRKVGLSWQLEQVGEEWEMELQPLADTCKIIINVMKMQWKYFANVLDFLFVKWNKLFVAKYYANTWNFTEMPSYLKKTMIGM